MSENILAEIQEKITKIYQNCLLAKQEYDNLINNLPLNKSNSEILVWTYKLHRLEGAKRICTGKDNDHLEGEKMGYAVAEHFSRPIEFEVIK